MVGVAWDYGSDLSKAHAIDIVCFSSSTIMLYVQHLKAVNWGIFQMVSLFFNTRHFLFLLACYPKPCWGLTGHPWTFAIKDGTYLYRQQPSGRPTSLDATLPLGLRDFSGDDLFCWFSSFAANLLTLAWDENAIHFVRCHQERAKTVCLFVLFVFG